MLDLKILKKVTKHAVRFKLLKNFIQKNKKNVEK